MVATLKKNNILLLELTFNISSLSDLQVYERMMKYIKEDSEMLGLKNVEEKENKRQEINESQEAVIGGMLCRPVPPYDEKEENELLRKENVELKKRLQELRNWISEASGGEEDGKEIKEENGGR